MLQVLFASAAWFVAAKAVLRAAQFTGETGAVLAATIRELRRTGREADVAQLGVVLTPSPIGGLLEDEGRCDSAEELVAEAERGLRAAAPPTRALRGLATIGTTFGLLAAVAALRTGLSQSSGLALEQAAGRALDSAVLGFVTALPCWTAVGLCRTLARRAAVSLEPVLLALRAGPDHAATSDGDEPGEVGVEPVDGLEQDQ